VKSEKGKGKNGESEEIMSMKWKSVDEKQE
jgi:hypothetical protein